jgi:biotin synthase-like enzyme
MTHTCFERAIFFSWYCDIKDCKFCYMSTQPLKTRKIARRSVESILAEVILTKKFGWELGFFSGGIGAFSEIDFRRLVELVFKVYGQKIWLNIGPLKKAQLAEYKPYIKGVVGSIETVNPKVHDKVCPSKPMQPYFEMFEEAEKLGLMRAMTIILGLGETIDDFDRFCEIVDKYGITKVHFYGLNPQKGTIFEDAEPPTADYQAEWIKKTREKYPGMSIQFGIWLDRVDRVSQMLNAGANSISKFPALRYFGSGKAKQIEVEAKKAGFEFKGSLTEMPDVDWDKEVDVSDLDDHLKEKVREKLRKYLKRMK